MHGVSDAGTSTPVPSQFDKVLMKWFPEKNNGSEVMCMKVNAGESYQD